MHQPRSEQGRLATPRGSDQREEPPSDEVTDGLGDHLLPTEEELRIDLLEPCESLVRAHIRWSHRLCTRRPTGFKLGIVGEDRRPETWQRGAPRAPQPAAQPP